MKKEITEVFATLRKAGYLVLCFNNSVRLTKGMSGFVDYMIVNSRNIVFVEVKIGRDTLNPEQEKIKEHLTAHSNKYSKLIYRIVKTKEEAIELRDLILLN